MSSRLYHTSYAQNTVLVDYTMAFLPQGTGAPVLGEGDPNGTYLAVARTGVGLYTVTTKDPFPGVVAGSAAFSLATPNATTTYSMNWAKNTNNTWTFTIQIYSAGAAADIAANAQNQVILYLSFRNSTVNP